MKRHYDPKPGSVRSAFAHALWGLAGALPPATVDGLFAAMSLARPHVRVSASTWWSVVTEDVELSESDSRRLMELGVLAFDELQEDMTDNAAACVPPAWSEERIDWCRGFIMGIGLCKEPAASQLGAATLVLHMGVLCGMHPFRKLVQQMQDVQQRPWRTTKEQWRQDFEEQLPRMLFEVAYEQSGYGRRKAARLEASKVARRNGPCPCGSGNKYRRCCGAAS